MWAENRIYWFRVVALWFLLMGVETCNGLWRANVLSLWIGEASARDASVITGSLLILLITFACVGWIYTKSTRTLLAVGFAWVGLTISFEFALGRLVFYLPWRDVLAEFDLTQGSLLPLGLLVLLFAPLVAGFVRSRIVAAKSRAARSSM